MLLKLPDGSVYAAHFEHHNEIVEVLREGGAARCIRRRRSTECRLHAGECERSRDGKNRPCLLAHWRGEVACHFRDQFVKSIGRKLALTRALESWTAHNFGHADEERDERSFRRAIWLAYFTATNRMPTPKERAR